MSYRVATILTSSYKLRYEKYKNRLVEIYNAMFQTFVLYYIFDYLIIRDDCRIYPMALVQLIWVPPTFLPKLAPTITELFFQILFYWIAFDFSYFWFHLLHHRVSFAVFFNLFASSGKIPVSLVSLRPPHVFVSILCSGSASASIRIILRGHFHHNYPLGFGYSSVHVLDVVRRRAKRFLWGSSFPILYSDFVYVMIFNLAVLIL